MDAGEFKTNSKDEIGVLTGAMGRMKARTPNATQMMPSTMRGAAV